LIKYRSPAKTQKSSAVREDFAGSDEKSAGKEGQDSSAYQWRAESGRAERGSNWMQTLFAFCS